MSSKETVTLEVESYTTKAKGQIEFVPCEVAFAISDKGDFCIFGMAGVKESFIVRMPYEELRAKLFDTEG